MPDGACVVVYEGKRGRVYRIKYRDAEGEQVMETLGRESDGWNRRTAEDELRARLTDVRRDGLRRTTPVTVADFAERWREDYADRKGLKRSTRDSYKTIIEKHLSPSLGHVKLGAVSVEHVERYITGKRRAGLSSRTINRHLNLLHLLFVSAAKRKLVRENPVSLVDRPKDPHRRWTILRPEEIGAVERAFRELIEHAATEEERRWREQARVIFLTMIDTGLRRGEVLGLRWRDVELADPEGPKLHVRETWVRCAEDTPKSEAGARTVAVSDVVAGELFEHRARSAFEGDDERVFASQTGAPFDVARYSGTFESALAKAKITRPMRPFHDCRHTAITNDAASGMSPEALMTKHGHTDFKTTRLYIDLAGEVFREDSRRAAERKFAHLRAPSPEPVR